MKPEDVPDEAVVAFVEAAWVEGRGIVGGDKITAGLVAAAPYLNRESVEALEEIEAMTRDDNYPRYLIRRRVLDAIHAAHRTQ